MWVLRAGRPRVALRMLHCGRHGFVPHSAAAYFFDCSSQTQRVNWLDQPAFGTAAACEMYVSDTVEQHHHGDVWQATTAFVESQIHGYGHGAHRAHLEVEHRHIGRALGNGKCHIAAITTHRERSFRSPKRCNDVVEHVLSVGSDQNMHEARLSLGVATVVVSCSPHLL